MRAIKTFAFFSLLMVACVVIITSCEKEFEEPMDLGYDYYPIFAGQVNHYTIDSIYYDEANAMKDSVRVFMRENIISESKDSQGFNTYLVDRYLSKDTSLGWEKDRYYFYRKDLNFVNEVMGNTSTTIFAFPVQLNKKWNINLYNSMAEESAYFSSFSDTCEPYTDCLKILFRNDVNFIEENVWIDMYVKQVGLVKRVWKDIKISSGKKNGLEIIQMRY